MLIFRGVYHCCFPAARVLGSGWNWTTPHVPASKDSMCVSKVPTNKATRTHAHLSYDENHRKHAGQAVLVPYRLLVWYVLKKFQKERHRMEYMPLLIPYMDLNHAITFNNKNSWQLTGWKMLEDDPMAGRCWKTCVFPFGTVLFGVFLVMNSARLIRLQLPSGMIGEGITSHLLLL